MANIKRLPYSIVFVLTNFGKEQAKDFVDFVLNSLTPEEIVDLSSQLEAGPTYFKDNISTFVDTRELKSLLASQFGPIKKEALEYWSEIIATLHNAFKKVALPKVKQKVKQLQDSGAVSTANIVESIFKY